MKVTLYTEDEQFEALTKDWDELLSRSVTDTLFLTWDWQRTWWRAFGEGKQLLLLTIREDDGELVGIAPLFRCDVVVSGDARLPELSIEHSPPEQIGATVSGIFFIGGTEVSDYLDLVIRLDRVEPVCAELMAFLCDELKGWEMLDLHCIPAASPTSATLKRLAEQRNLLVVQAREDVCPVLDLPATWGEYLSSLTRKQRHELRRKRRRLYREVDARYHVLRDADSFDKALASFYRLHELSAVDKAAFWSDRMRGFFYNAASTTMRQERLRLSFLYAGDEPIATLLSFEYKDEYLVYNSGFNPVKHRALAPGIVLTSHCIEDAISRGLRRFDFLQGDERYKYDLGAADTEVLRLVIHRKEG